jgi:hypothetical protein
MENAKNFYLIVRRLVEDQVLFKRSVAGKGSGLFEFGMANFAGSTHLLVGGEQIESCKGFRQETQAGVETGLFGQVVRNCV